ncbi:antitoxin [Desulfosarcina ovata]|uniref:Uncharacterized protein n=1 Tax=Desulfosarcina ovata subsp. ovata TaxID=2752305 RepID=A0A5K8AJK9_9BACT|nr:antitoxin [Desulfosarcina ovata]BBO92887.1 hypothetical protein DSCOOX_60670 [Desulfosarcina ovata subsp. ovata]
MKAITIRGVDQDLADKLKDNAKKQSKSINQLAIELIRSGLGLSKKKQFTRQYDDLDDLFGKWSQEEFETIDVKISHERKIDPEIWS